MFKLSTWVLLASLLACGGARAPAGRCEVDSDCAASERCAQVAVVCEAPPFCGVCLPK